jgi:N-methylhydantoinase B
VELDELKHPLHVILQRVAVDTGGAGKFRGAPAAEVIYGPKFDPMTVIIPSDGQHYPPEGVLGGSAGSAGRTFKIDIEGRRHQLPNVCTVELNAGELIYGLDCGGGGYGYPWDRDPERVLNDLSEGWISLKAATDIYRVAFSRDANGDLSIDWHKTGEFRRDRDLAA